MKRIAILAFPGVQMLDVAGPADVFSEAMRQAKLPDACRIEVLGTVAGPIRASNGMRFFPDATFDSVAPGIDTLLIAGGPDIDPHVAPALLAWLRAQAGQVRRIGSVCSGAFLLAHAGILDGKRATTHWNSSARLAHRFPGIAVEPDRIYVRDGAVYTSAGITAGMDLALALVEEDFGRDVAMRVAREFVMFLKRPGGQSQFSTHLAAQSAEKDAIRGIQSWVLEHLDQVLTIEQLAREAGMSTRHFARIFKQETALTPGDFVDLARVDVARRLLEDSEAPLKRIAARSGFGDTSTLRRAFTRRLGVSPLDYRRRFRDPGAGLA